jgi:hypothetical protein
MRRMDIVMGSTIAVLAVAVVGLALLMRDDQTSRRKMRDESKHRHK